MSEGTVFGYFLDEHVIAENEGRVAAEVDGAGELVGSGAGDDDCAGAIDRGLQGFGVGDTRCIGREAELSRVGEALGRSGF